MDTDIQQYFMQITSINNDSPNGCGNIGARWIEHYLKLISSISIESPNGYGNTRVRWIQIYNNT